MKNYPIVLEDAETLCHQLLYEIACDVLEAGGNFDDIFKSSPAEKDEILKTFQPYLEKLPEYKYLADKLFMEPSDDE